MLPRAAAVLPRRLAPLAARPLLLATPRVGSAVFSASFQAAPRANPTGRSLSTSAFVSSPGSPSSSSSPKMASFYDFSVKDIKRNETSLKEYAGKVVLVVNVASKCGYTRQYEGLQKIWSEHKDKGTAQHETQRGERVRRGRGWGSGLERARAGAGSERARVGVRGRAKNADMRVVCIG